MIESLQSRIHFAVFTPVGPADSGYPAVTDNAFLRQPVSGGKTLAAFRVPIPLQGYWDEQQEYTTRFSRYLSDGSLDKSFGKNGYLDVGQTSQVEIVPNSRILVVPDYEGRIKAYSLNGRVDVTFGGGDGVIETPTVFKFENGNVFDRLRIVGILDNGQLLTQTDINTVGRRELGYTKDFARLNTDGSVDANFAKQGHYVYKQTGYGDVDLMVGQDGLFIHTDRLFSTDPPSGELLKLSLDAKTIDTSFGGDGRVDVPGFVTHLTERPDGKLLFLDTTYGQDPVLYRLNANGTADTGFSGDGKVTLTYNDSAGHLNYVNNGASLVFDDNGRIVVSANGTIYRFSTSGTLDGYPFNGTAPFPTGISSVDNDGRVVGGDGLLYKLDTPQQINAKGVITIVTDSRDDTIKVADAGDGRTRVIVNGESRLFRTSRVRGISIKAYDGALSVNVSVNVPVTLESGEGNATIVTADGNDDIKTGSGDHTLALGGGDDTVRVGDTPPVDAETDPNPNDRQIITATGGNKAIEFLNGTATITLPAGDHDVSGYREVHDSVITIAGGNNTVRLSGIGGDTVTIGGRGKNNVTVFGENTRVATGAGSDEILAISPYGNIDTGRGNDVVTIRNFGQTPTRGVTVNGGEGDDHIFCDNTYQSLATVYGGGGNDLLEGNTLSQRLYGEGGDDTLFGGDGNDYLFGGTGNDLLRGGNQSDRLYGDAGLDRLYGQQGNDTLKGGDDNDRLYAENGNDSLFGDNGLDRFYVLDALGRRTFFGGSGDDRFYTLNYQPDTLLGEAGDDTADADLADELDSVTRF